MQRVYFFPILCCFFFPFFFSHCIAISQGLTYKYIQYRYSRIRERIRCAVKRIFFFYLSSSESWVFFFLFGRERRTSPSRDVVDAVDSSVACIYFFCLFTLVDEKECGNAKICFLIRNNRKEKKIGTFLIALAQRPVA